MMRLPLPALNDTLNLSQGVEIQVKQSPQIQNTDYLTFNQAVIIPTCHANNSNPEYHLYCLFIPAINT